MRSSKPTASAQPISRPSDFQPGSKRQARHLCPSVMPIPKPELASEKAWRSERSIGPGMGRERLEDPRRSVHHSRSLDVLRGGVCGMKGQLLKPESMVSKVVRYAHPAGITREV